MDTQMDIDGPTLETIANDVLDLILDRITLPSHLKAVCLISKKLNSIATPRLYRKIALNIIDQDHIDRFIVSMEEAGAKRHLGVTRSLAFRDSYPPRESESLLPGRLNFDHMKYELEETGNSLKPVAASHMLQIVRMFPENGLNTFRFISHHAIDVRTFVVLVANHRSSLHNLHTTFNSRDFLPEISKQQPLHLNTLDLWIPVREPILNLVPLLKTQHRCLRRLCLATFPEHMPEGGLRYRNLDWTKLQDVVPAATGQEILRRVTLSGFDLARVHQPLSTIFDLKHLTHLSLLESLNPHEFLDGLATSANGHVLELRHLAVCFKNIQGDGQDEARALDQFLSLCNHLQSLQIEWARPFPIAKVLPRFESFGPSLRSLGLHLLRRKDSQDILGGEQLLKLCMELPNLEQFAFAVADRRIFDEQTFLSEIPIADLSNLRILYLRQNFNDPFELEDPAVNHPAADQRALNWFCQKFASSVFEHMHSKGFCKNLQAIVLGKSMQMTYAPAQDDFGYTPRKCFVKGVQKDIFGRTSVVGVPVPTYLLRELTDYSEILDWQSDWAPGDWMDRIPGRFHDS